MKLCLLLILVSVVAVAVASVKKKKTIVLFGIAGVGKSTISNCLLNQRGDMASIVDGPFPVCEDCGSGNLAFQVRSNAHFTIIDSIGFGSMEFNAAYILDQMRSVFARVNFEIDCVMYVIGKGRLTNETYQFVRTFQEEVMRHKARFNSILVVNRCQKGWLDKEAQRRNPYMQLMLASVNRVSYELDLKWDHSTDCVHVRRHNARGRQQTIDELVHFVASLPLVASIQLDHIRSREFESSWLHYLFSYLSTLASAILNGSFFDARSTEYAQNKDPCSELFSSIFCLLAFPLKMFSNLFTF